MRLRLAVLIALLVAASPAAAAGPLAPGTLDRTFAGDGTLRSRLGSGGGDIQSTDIAVLGGNRLAVVTTRETVVRVRASGGLDRRFGRRGVTRLRRTAAAKAIAAADGGLVVAGLAHGAALAVTRLLPNGRPDTRFGNRGLVVTEINDFVSSEHVVAAPDGTAAVATVVRPAPFHPDDHRVIVQRLDGRGVTGTTTINLADPALAAGLVRLADGRLRYLLESYPDSGRPRLLLVGLTADGRPDTAVGPRGLRDLGAPLPSPDRRATGPPDVALTRSGRLLVSGSPTRRRVLVLAFRADGEPDPGFGTGGAVRIALPFSATSGALAARTNGGVAVVVNRRLRPRRPAVLLLRPDGARVRRFGPRGIAPVSRFPRRRVTVMGVAVVDRLDRLVLGGFSGNHLLDERDDFANDFVALARLRLRRPPLTLPARARVKPSGVLRVPVHCRAATRCMARLTVSRGSLRRHARLRLRACGRRVVRMRLGTAGARLRSVRLAAKVRTPRTPTEPLAVRVRLRR